VLPAAIAALAVTGAASGCPAPHVHTTANPLLPRPFAHGSRWIAPAPRRLLAVMWAGRAVDGRFSVYAHGLDPVTGTAEKIMWVVPWRAVRRSGSTLRLEWTRGRRRFVQRQTGVDGSRQQRSARIYPSILRPPAPGCWKLRVKINRIEDTMYVLVQPQPRAEQS
jgi:hypothetical protein